MMRYGKYLKGAFLVLGSLLLLGCGPDIDGKWDISGDFYPGTPFVLQVMVEDGRIQHAYYEDQTGFANEVVICDFRLNEDSGDFSFTFNPKEKKQDCNTLKDVYLVKGHLGYASITGDIYNSKESKIGILRGLKKME